MKLSAFRSMLGQYPDANIVIQLPDGSTVPRHFHVTEVGRVTKDFVDCGGTFRSSEACVLQTWTGVERDDGHRLTAGKLVHILGLAGRIIPSQEIPVEVEHEAGLVSQYPVASIEGTSTQVTVLLARKHTDCLARESCRTDGQENCGCADGATEQSEAACCAGSAASTCCG